MKNDVPPWAAAAILAVVALIVGAFLYFGTGPGRQAKEMEEAINATVARPSAKPPGALTGGSPGPPGPPGPATAPAPQTP
jgi:hypothetical protein